MAYKKKKKNVQFGFATTISIVLVTIVLLSAVLSKLGVQAEMTSLTNGSLVVSYKTVKNFISGAGIKYLFSNIILNFKMFEPLALMILSVITFSIFEVSGLLQKIFSKWKKLSNKTLTLLVVLLGFISTIFGEYSFALMLPFAGVLYRFLGKNPMLGVVTAFLGTSLGYGSGLLFNNDQFLLGKLTEAAAKVDVDKNYVFHAFSSSIITTVSTILFVPVISALINNYVAPYFEKPIIKANDKNESKKALFYSTILFSVILAVIVFMIIPGKYNLLLDMTQDNYFDQLFSTNAPFKEAISFIFLLLIALPSYVYGKISKNIETSIGVTDSLAVGLQDCGYLYLIAFLGSILIGVLEWTGMGEFIVCELIEILSKFQISGIILIAIFFILVIVMAFFVPSTLTKWSLMSPIAVPLFMRANVTPDFTQFIFQVADGVGKSISLFFPYFLLLIGMMYKYNSEDVKISVEGTMKRLLPVVLITAAFLIIFLIIWYLAGFPVGISEYATL